LLGTKGLLLLLLLPPWTVHLGPYFEIPAGSVTSISLITLAVFIPIYDQTLAIKFTGLDSVGEKSNPNPNLLDPKSAEL
jgi:hypothetical protein